MLRKPFWKRSLVLEWLWLLPVYPWSSIPHDEGRGIWILPKISYWCNARFSTGHFFSLHPHILQNSSFSCQNVTMPVATCAMCNTTVHKQLSSLAEFQSLMSTGSVLSHHWRLSAGCRTCNYDFIIHKNDTVRFLGLTYQKSRENIILLKQEWKVDPLFWEFQVLLQDM